MTIHIENAPNSNETKPLSLAFKLRTVRLIKVFIQKLGYR